MCDSVLFKNNIYLNSQEQTRQLFVQMRNIHVIFNIRKTFIFRSKRNPFDINKCFGDLMTVNFSKLKKSIIKISSTIDLELLYHMFTRIICLIR